MPDPTLRDLDGLVARLKDGDRGASRPVFAILWPRLVRFASRALGGDAGADDVAQTAIATLFARVVDYDPARPALAWAFAIAGWECRTHLKRRQRRGETALASPDAFVDPDTPESLALDAALHDALADALEELSPADRETLRRAFADAEDDVASDATFRKRKQRALERLRGAWRRIHGT
ncbi:MAG: sigma-70 family RNA polymerase sigma factor [Polyangiaceae bacterium]